MLKNDIQDTQVMDYKSIMNFRQDPHTTADHGFIHYAIYKDAPHCSYIHYSNVRIEKKIRHDNGAIQVTAITIETLQKRIDFFMDFQAINQEMIHSQ